MEQAKIFSILVVVLMLLVGAAGYLNLYSNNTLIQPTSQGTEQDTEILNPLEVPSEPIFKVENGTPVLSLSPTIIRDIKVIRNGEVIAEYQKIGDPFTKVWQALVADWMFGLYYWNGGSKKITALATDGDTLSWFDTEFDGRAYLTLYISNNDTYTTYDSYQLPEDKIKGVISISKSISTDTEYIWVITGSYTHTVDTPYTVRAVYLTLTSEDKSNNLQTYLILADKVIPEIVLNNGDTISVTWYIKFPRQPPLTNTFMGVLSYFLGRTENSFSVSLDIGKDYYLYSYDKVKESIYFEPVTASGVALSKVGVYEATVEETNTGITVTLYAQYTAESSITVTHVNIYLLSDSLTGKYTSSSYYKILSFDLDTPVNLDGGDVLIMKLTVYFPNQFTG